MVAWLSRSQQAAEVIGTFAAQEFNTRQVEANLREPPYGLHDSNAHSQTWSEIKRQVKAGRLRRVLGKRGTYVRTVLGAWLDQETVIRDTARGIGNQEAEVDGYAAFPRQASNGRRIGITVVWKNPPPKELFFGREFTDAERSKHPLVDPNRMLPGLPSAIAKKVARRPLPRTTIAAYDKSVRELVSLLNQEPGLGRYLLRDLLSEVVARTPAVVFAYPVRLVRVPRSMGWSRIATVIAIPEGQALPHVPPGSYPRYVHRRGVKMPKVLRWREEPAFSLKRGLSAVERNSK